MKKGVLVAIAITLLLFIGGIAYIYASIGSVISDTIASRGSDITQTTVAVQDSDYSTTSGLATLTKVTIANPAGFKSPLAFNFDRIEMWIDPETLNSNTIHVKSLTFVAPEVTYEISVQTDNLRTLINQIENSISRSVPSASDKRLILEQVQFKNGVVVVQSDDMQGARSTAQLADMNLQNIGKAENGISPAEIAHRLTIALLRETTIAALNTDLPLSDQARNILNGAMDETKKAIKLFRNLLN